MTGTGPGTGTGEVVLPVDDLVRRPSSAHDRRARELVGVGLWALAAVAWVAAMTVPWFRGGVLGHVSPLSVASLLRSGVFGVPTVTGYGVLLLPGVAVVLLGLAPLRGLGVQVARVLLWAVASVAGLALVVVLRGVTGGDLGVGAALVVVGCALGGGALSCSTVRPR